VFDKNDQFAADFKRNVVNHVHEQNVLKGVDDDGDIAAESYPLQCAVEFSQNIRITEDEGENAAFKFPVNRAHKVTSK
jgi:hypothetical protein